MARRQNRGSTVNSIAPARPLIVVYGIVAMLALAGLADAVYLTVMHLTGQAAVCGGSALCSKVLGSKYAHLGPVPVALFGALAYFAVFSFATFAAFGYAGARRFLAGGVTLMFAATLWFLFVQAFLLHAFCRYCLFSAAIVFLLTGLLIAMKPGSRI